MKSPTNRISRCVVLGILCALLTPTATYASDASIEQLYSDRFEALTGYALTEDGVRTVLKQMLTFERHPMIPYHSSHKYAAISVLGEQKLRGLIPDLIAIYHRQPEDVPLELKYLYKSPGYKDVFQPFIARALIRCGAREGEKLVLELAMRAGEMNAQSAIETVRNLKVLVEEFGTDVSHELESILNLYAGQSDKIGKRERIFRRLIRELDEIIVYTKRTGCPGYSKYVSLVYESRQTLSTYMRYSTRQKLKVLAREFGTDVSDEFEFLFDLRMNDLDGNHPDGWYAGLTDQERGKIVRVMVRDLLQEIYDIRRYAELSGCPNRRKYDELITRIRDEASDDVLSAIDSFDSEYVPRWREIHGLRGQLSVAKKFQSMRQR